MTSTEEHPMTQTPGPEAPLSPAEQDGAFRPAHVDPLRIERAVHAIAVQGARTNARQIAVPHLVCIFGQGDALDLGGNWPTARLGAGSSTQLSKACNLAPWRGGIMMALSWIVLILSGVLESVWAAALTRSEGFTRLWPSVVFGVALAFSMAGLGWSLRSIPWGCAAIGRPPLRVSRWTARLPPSCATPPSSADRAPGCRAAHAHAP